MSLAAEALAEAVGRQLLARRQTLSAAESCTGGLVTSCLTDVAGSSAYVKGAVVSYTNEVKADILGVDPGALASVGAVSAPVAQQMAEGVRRLLETDIGVGITGIAGPGGATAEQPVGLVFIAVSGGQGTLVQQVIFSGNRKEIKWQAAEEALRMVGKYLA